MREHGLVLVGHLLVSGHCLVVVLLLVHWQHLLLLSCAICLISRLNCCGWCSKSHWHHIRMMSKRIWNGLVSLLAGSFGGFFLGLSPSSLLSSLLLLFPFAGFLFSLLGCCFGLGLSSGELFSSFVCLLVCVLSLHSLFFPASLSLLFFVFELLVFSFLSLLVLQLLVLLVVFSCLSQEI